jgi:hypothetical protein
MTAMARVATHAGRMKRAIAPVSAVALLLCTAPAVRAADVDDIAAPYLQRTDSIAAGAGNAKAVNSVTHMLDPWPPYAGNRRIPGNGQRMSGAVERYRDVSKQSQMPATLAPASAGQAGSSGSTTVPPSTGQ